MDFVWFRDLDNLAKTGNFSQAARLGNISQPAFSRRIQALEAWAGVSLVDRSAHPVKLTNAGTQLLEAGRQALGRLESEREQIRQVHSTPDQYVVTFSTQHSIGWRFYPDWLRDFEHAFGPIMSRLVADNLPNRMSALEQGAADFVIAYESERAPPLAGFKGLESILIGCDALVPVARSGSDGHALFTLAEDSPVPLPYLRFGNQAPMNLHIEPLLRERDLHRRLTVVYENSMAGALRIRAREGGGIAWLPKSLIRQDLESGLMSPAAGEELEIPLDVRLYRIRGHDNKLTRSIWTFLSAREKLPPRVAEPG